MQLLALFAMRGLAPHGYCLLWDPALLWLHVVSDAVIGLSYFSIPIALSVFLARRRDIEFGWMIMLFAIFITACGATHFMSILVLWVPAYGAEGLVKAVTAFASVLTAITIWPLLTKLIVLPSPRQLQLANEALRMETAERIRVETLLREAQKLEAIGRLTGGVAHDFNNIYTIVMGSIELAARKLAEPDKARAALAIAIDASKRAETLTAKLLSFSGEQALTVERHDLNEIVSEFGALVLPSLGQAITLIINQGDKPLAIWIDRGQLEVALVNLALNARDAMPDGGTLTIDAFEATPDDMAICISDTGAGMDAQTLQRATEPFYTTKPIGQGAGLGLSHVYGFARQAGGSLAITSRRGEGTSVTITLPRRSGEIWLSKA